MGASRKPPTDLSFEGALTRVEETYVTDTLLSAALEKRRLAKQHGDTFLGNTYKRDAQILTSAMRKIQKINLT